MIKLIATDIDGTLLQNGETEISPRFFAAAQRLMDSGVAVCAASGRQYKKLQNLISHTTERMYFIRKNNT